MMGTTPMSPVFLKRDFPKAGKYCCSIKAAITAVELGRGCSGTGVLAREFLFGFLKHTGETPVPLFR
jgi:hypothetical protein